MGLLRVILALSVLVAHSESFFGIDFIGGRLAVETFFVISGFYMTLVLTEKYGGIKDSYSVFISNRLLRILPVYWIVLISTIAVSILSGLLFGKFGIMEVYIQNYSQLNLFSSLYFFFSNLLIVGQDVAYFLQFTPNSTFRFATDFGSLNPRVYQFFIIPQAWTLALEVTFYTLAPFLVKLKNQSLVWLCLFCLTLKMATLSSGFDHDPWTYRFLVFELMYFLLGILSYRMYAFIRKANVNPSLFSAALPILLLFISFYSIIPGKEAKETVYFLLVTLALPLIYSSYHNNRMDRYVGEFSYTIYITHFVVLDVVMKAVKIELLPKALTAEIACIICIFLSWCLIKFISTKVEAFRARRIRTKINLKEQPVYSLLLNSSPSLHTKSTG
jgi:peptidoglycan/LPS O-acetylase OafA/YrhL